MTTENKINILLIEDEEFDVQRVKNTIELFKDNFIISAVVSSGIDALRVLSENADSFDIVIMDYQIAGGLRGEELITKIKEIDPTLQIIVITKLTLNISDFNFARKLLQAGAVWYCTKYPGNIEQYIYQPTDFILSIFNAYERKKLETQRQSSNKKLQSNINLILRSHEIVSESEALYELKRKILKIADSELDVSINGPSGTGKELVAYNIHYQSKRKFEEFVPVNCGSIPQDLMESEFFGYEKGAFTGAEKSKVGLFELANKGTIFLDEIAELPLAAQVKLLRVIQDGEIEKIGRTKRLKVDVRIIAATNKNLQEEVSAGRFREDLFYRLNVYPIFISPLNERKEDIPVLVHHFIKLYANDMNKIAPAVPDEVMDVLLKYHWPGNVRELKNVVQRMVFSCTDAVTMADLNSAMIGKLTTSEEIPGKLFNFEKDEIIPMKEMEERFKIDYIKFVRVNSISDSEAAGKLGLPPSNYHRLCKKLGLK